MAQVVLVCLNLQNDISHSNIEEHITKQECLNTQCMKYCHCSVVKAIVLNISTFLVLMVKSLKQLWSQKHKYSEMFMEKKTSRHVSVESLCASPLHRSLTSLLVESAKS